MVVDKNEVIASQYFDGLGRLIKTVADSGASRLNATTSFVYDAMDQLLISETPPKNSGASNVDVTRYWYDSLGRLVKKFQPDADTTRYKYDRLSRLRFSQDSLQVANGKVTFLSYLSASCLRHLPVPKADRSEAPACAVSGTGGRQVRTSRRVLRPTTPTGTKNYHRFH